MHSAFSLARVPQNGAGPRSPHSSLLSLLPRPWPSQAISAGSRFSSCTVRMDTLRTISKDRERVWR